MAEQLQRALTILRIKQVQAQTGLSRSGIYARLKPNPKRPGDYDPTFPKPVPLGAGSAVGWISAEVSDWVVGRIASRDAALANMPRSVRAADHTSGGR